jgi:hypothetical protein
MPARTARACPPVTGASRALTDLTLVADVDDDEPLDEVHPPTALDRDRRQDRFERQPRCAPDADLDAPRGRCLGIDRDEEPLDPSSRSVT